MRSESRTGIRALAAAGLALAVVAGSVLASTSTAQAPVGIVAAAAGSVRFTASGDFSSTPNSFAVFNGIKAIKPNLHIALGDLSYGTPGTEQVWCDDVTSRVGAGFPFELISGNHESNGQNGNINDFAACLPNQLPGAIGTYGRQYYVDVPAGDPLVRFVLISPGLTYPDGAWSYAAGSPRYNWTAAAIDGARTAGIPWVVVGMHKPCLSMGTYTCDPGTDIISMLVDKRVDLVLSGHEHLYQRSKQIATSTACPTIVTNSYNAACVADSDSTMVKGAGTVFATVGTGGVPFRDVNTADTEAAYFAAYQGLNANPTWGSLDVTATATDLSASFARASGGTFADAFTLTAAPPPPPSSDLARDDFTRTVTNGWGSATTGGAYTITGTTTPLSVQAGTGQINLPAGSTRTATLGSISATSADTTVSFALDKLPTGGGSYSTVFGRQVGAANYAASVWVKSTGAVVLVLKQGATVLSTTTVPGVTYTAGAVLTVRLQVTGTSPTTVRAKVWLASQSESVWLATTTDSTAALQAAGSVGVQSYLSGTATAPVVTKWDDLLVTPAN